ncbi:AfsA-related hotdog domain-containing protein [Streptomyces sp. NBC_00203]|uniref:AfsA-related hotdog domain-containing protein n=1 Tax=Streptomyces sp. NBC_00203 TaxID=2975680 RepID=UPI003244A7E1
MTAHTVQAPAPVLSTDRTVPKQLVHKRAVEQVLTTAVARAGDRLLGSAQLPRLHRHYNDTTVPYFDLLLVGEAARQTVEAIVHELLEVPLDSRFVLSDLRIEFTDPEAVRIPRVPADLLVELHVARLRRRRDGSVRTLEGTALCRIGDREAARFSGTLLFLAADAYEILRTDDALPGEPLPKEPMPGKPMPGEPVRATNPARADPPSVGRNDPRNVVIGGLRTNGAEAEADLVFDPDDPVFFDHPLDHLPGMLLLEAGRQLALATWSHIHRVPATRLLATSCHARFQEFADLADPVVCRARLTPDSTVEVVVEQRGTTAALLEIAVVSVPDPPDGAGEPEPKDTS